MKINLHYLEYEIWNVITRGGALRPADFEFKCQAHFHSFSSYFANKIQIAICHAKSGCMLIVHRVSNLLKLLTSFSDKSTSTTFQLVHREQDDPLQHDESSSSVVFRPLASSQGHKIKSRNDLEADLFGPSSDPSQSQYEIRDNEGEAAENGIYFDDTEYDYMQHVRDLNSGDVNSESFFVEAKGGKNNGKAKVKMSLEDALRQSSLQEEETGGNTPSDLGSLLGSEPTSSSGALRRGIEIQQEVPDALAGFQPDMDPRLREVLEALDDEAYVDDEEELFGEITEGRQELSLDEFQETLYNDFDEDDDGWESDVTEKPQHEYMDSDTPAERLSEADLTMLNAPLSEVPDVMMGDTEASRDSNTDWMEEFSKFKQNQKSSKPKLRTPALDADLQSSVMTGASMTSGRKKRKGAMTSSTGFSMTSSALARTEGLTTLDRRFDKIEEDYAEDDFDDRMPEDTASIATKSSRASNVSMASGASSQAPSLVRGDFDSIMDEFLGGYQIKGKRVKKGGHQTGMEQLDEVRKGLGPARLKSKATFI